MKIGQDYFGQLDFGIAEIQERGFDIGATIATSVPVDLMAVFRRIARAVVVYIGTNGKPALSRKLHRRALPGGNADLIHLQNCFDCAFAHAHTSASLHQWHAVGGSRIGQICAGREVFAGAADYHRANLRLRLERREFDLGFA